MFPIETAVAVLLKGDKVLLEKRGCTKSLYPDTWCFLGGFKREGEDPIQVLKHRMQEELGIEVEDPKLVDDFEDDSPIEGKIVHHLFLVDNWRGELSAKLGAGSKVVFALEVGRS